jgi:hypothetical protein
MPDPTEFPEAEQERARALIRSADATAPPALRAALEAQIAEAEREQQSHRPRPERPWRRERTPGRAWGGFALPGLAAVAAVAIVVIVLVATGESSSPAPRLEAAAAVALRAPTAPAPAFSGGELDVSADGIAFPYWQATVGWRATGTRTDTLNGRRVVTVFYSAAKGEQVGYSIVGGSPLKVPSGQVINRDGVAFTVLRAGGAHVVTWERNGHTCVMASQVASPQRLIALAMSPA